MENTLWPITWGEVASYPSSAYHFIGIDQLACKSAGILKNYVAISLQIDRV